MDSLYGWTPTLRLAVPMIFDANGWDFSERSGGWLDIGLEARCCLRFMAAAVMSVGEWLCVAGVFSAIGASVLLSLGMACLYSISAAIQGDFRLGG